MNGKTRPARGPKETEDADPVEVAGMESFPASDPPSWIPVHVGRPEGRRRRSAATTVKKALFVRLEAKPGKERDVEAFLNENLPLLEREPGTMAWFAIRMGPLTYGIFDAFLDDVDREAHLAGTAAEALKARSEELFRTPPLIERLDVLVAKLR